MNPTVPQYRVLSALVDVARAAEDLQVLEIHPGTDGHASLRVSGQTWDALVLALYALHKAEKVALEGASRGPFCECVKPARYANTWLQVGASETFWCTSCCRAMRPVNRQPSIHQPGDR